MIQALVLAAALADPAGAIPTAPAGSPPAAPPASKLPPAAAVRPLNTDRPVQMGAEEIRFNWKTRQVVVVGKPLVTLVHDDATLTCKRLTGENDAAGKLRVAVCEGDVRLVRAARVVTCERATYDRGAGRVVCTGHPQVRDPGGTEAHATTLTYDLTNDEIRLEGDAQITVPGSEVDAGIPSLKGTSSASPAPAPPPTQTPTPTPTQTPAQTPRRPGGTP